MPIILPVSYSQQKNLKHKNIAELYKLYKTCLKATDLLKNTCMKSLPLDSFITNQRKKRKIITYMKCHKSGKN